MADYGLTPYGWAYPALNDIREEIRAVFKAVYGENFNTGTNSIADKFISIIAEREYQLWQLGYQIYTAQTLQGAEGIYLDDLFGKLGIYRLGQQKAEGDNVLTVDNTVPYAVVYQATDYTVDNGNFVFGADTPMLGNITAHKIVKADLSIGTYDLYITNPITQVQEHLSLTLADLNDATIISFFGDIKQFIVDNTILENDNLIVVDSDNVVLYIGFNISLKMVGLVSTVDFQILPIVGERSVNIQCIAVEAGPLDRDAGTVTQISPQPDGYINFVNIYPYTSGTDVESDNAYRIRAIALRSASSGKATRPAIITALLGVEGVQRVKVFVNNTNTTDGRGIPPYMFETVVYGGLTEDISKALYNTIACSNRTFGTTSYNIQTEDGQTEVIRHTKASAYQLAVRVTYKGNPLTLNEENTVKQQLTSLVNASDINDTIYNINLTSAVVSSLTPNRFTKLVVETKPLADPDTSYTQDDITAPDDGVFNVSADNIFFIREV